MLVKATNIAKGRLLNLWVVFEEIRRHGPLSRSGVAQRTGLSKQAISSIVEELQDEGLVREEARVAAGVGKPSTPLVVNAAGAYAVGLHLDFGRLFAVLTDLGGNVVRRETVAIETASPAETVEPVAAVVERMIGGAPAGRLLGVGLAMPGLFGVEGLGPTRLRDWNGVAFRGELERRLRLPVSFNSESTSSAIAEWRFGAARSFDSFVYVFVGNGVGSGLIFDGHPVIGATGNSGDLGHVIVQPGGTPCVCGKRGCLETYVSSLSALEHLRTAGIAAPNLEAVPVAEGRAGLAGWLSASAEPLRIGINAIENLLDPETIVVGGDVPGWLLDALFAAVQPLYPSPAKRRRSVERLMRGTLGPDVAAVGASVLPLFAALDPAYKEPADMGPSS